MSSDSCEKNFQVGEPLLVVLRTTCGTLGQGGAAEMNPHNHLEPLDMTHNLAKTVRGKVIALHLDGRDAAKKRSPNRGEAPLKGYQRINNQPLPGVYDGMTGPIEGQRFVVRVYR